MTTTSAPNQATPSTGRRILVISIAIIAALVAGFFLFANVFADYLWFDQLGFSSVLITQWIARIVMFVVGFLGMALPVWLVIQLAYRLRPVYARLSSQLDRYQEVVEPLRRLAMWGIPVFFGLFAGLSAGAQWQIAWMWANGTTTNVKDPQFGLDTGFYMFGMPFYTALIGFVSAVLLICLIVTAFVSYLYGSVRIGQGEMRISKSARIQIAITAGLYVLAQAVSLWLDRYATLYESNSTATVRNAVNVTGPTYSVANAVIPGQTILAIIAVLVAVLFFVAAAVGRWRFPLVGTALLVVSALVLGIGVPWAVTTFQVKPNQLRLESQYYERNIEGTKQAYAVDGMEKTDFTAQTTAKAGQLRADADTTASIRIMDPAIIGPAVNQVEQYKPYYQFQQPNLDVDRYTIDGKNQDVVVSVRELNMDNVDSAWQNQSVVYTHGYGIVAAAGNQRTDDGYPKYVERGIPTSGELSKSEKFEPRIYFGESSPLYSVVGAPKGSDPIEMDYPRGANDSSTETKTTFAGDGGPKIGNFFTKLIYALKFQSEQIIFSDYVNDDSQILYDRDPRTRVSKVAPYLTLDSDPYPTIVDGRIKWVVDGYTTSANYPYATGVSLDSALNDSSTDLTRPFDQINYIRNSVKATVDAYDGKVTLYAWDDKDPVLQTWQKIYPSTVKPYSQMSADLMSHVRYPTDLFKVQRNILGVYHVDNAQSFFQSDNVWTTPNDPNKDSTLQPPYYLTMKMPGQEAPAYSMFTSFIPKSATAATSRNVLTGYLAVDSDAGSTKGEKSPGYGKLRMLVIDSDTTVPGPGQVKNNFDGDTEVARYLNLLSQQRSEVLNGNLLTLPVGGGLLYVQPVYVQSSSTTKLPRLQKVLVSFGGNVAFENTLSEALDALFGGDSGAPTGDTGVNPDVTPTDNPTPEPTDTPTPSPTETAGTETPTTPTTPATPLDKSKLLDDAKQAMQDKADALKAGDLTAYAAADKRLTDIIQQLLTLEGK